VPPEQLAERVGVTGDVPAEQLVVGWLRAGSGAGRAVPLRAGDIRPGAARPGPARLLRFRCRPPVRAARAARTGRAES